MMFGGIDPEVGPQIHQVDPSGMITCYRANAIGKNSKTIIEYLEDKYDENLSLE